MGRAQQAQLALAFGIFLPPTLSMSSSATGAVIWTGETDAVSDEPDRSWRFQNLCGPGSAMRSFPVKEVPAAPDRDEIFHAFEPQRAMFGRDGHNTACHQSKGWIHLGLKPMGEDWIQGAASGMKPHLSQSSVHSARRTCSSVFSAE